MQAIHGDPTQAVRADTAAMDWQASPSGSVWRKRVHRVGGAESGQVTSIVRYEPGARFPAHDHPEGEEILVLQGTFSDEHGDWPAGSYLLNPEGFRHAPFSEEGCVLFVKLRQYAGAARVHVAVQTRDLAWQPSADDGIERKPLYDAPGFADTMQLERWAPGASRGETAYAGGVEMLVIEGTLEDAAGRHGPGHWLRLPAGSRHAARSPEGCTLYVKAGGVEALRAAG